jgi:chromate transporter
MKELLKIFIIFFRIGSFTFGGGYAMLPIIKRELVDNLGWVKEEDIYNYYAIGQSTPGIIAVNTATMTGYSLQGIKGALAATTGFIMPSLIIIILIASFFKYFQQIVLFQHAFAGIQIAVVALILDIVIKMWNKSDKSKISLLIFLTAFILLAVFDISPVFVILSAAAAGIIIQMLRKDINNKSEGDEH